MEHRCLLVTGAIDAGTTTFIRSASEIETVDTDTRTTDRTGLLKKSPTVAFDFGRLQLSRDMVLHLYGTPSHSDFDSLFK